MEISSFRNLADLGVDDPLYFHQWPMSSFDELSSVSADSGFYENLYHSYAQQPVQMDFKRTAEPSLTDPRPLKHIKTTNWNSCKIDSMSNSLPSNTFQVLNSGFAGQVGSVKPEEETWSSSSTLTFPSESVVSGKSPYANQNFMIKPCQEAKRVTMNTRLAQSQDHILAERKRREKLSQRFIALSTLIPGLKKMDKASVLGDAIKYMKQLQDKVKILEEQNKKRTMESVVFVKKQKWYADAENCPSNSAITTEALPELEAKFCNNDVLISIHCEKRKGMLEKTVAEIEKLHLSVVSSSVMSFGDSALSITVIAQKDEEFSLNIKEVVKQLRGAIGMFL